MLTQQSFKDPFGNPAAIEVSSVDDNRKNNTFPHHRKHSVLTAVLWALYGISLIFPTAVREKRDGAHPGALWREG